MKLEIDAAGEGILVLDSSLDIQQSEELKGTLVSALAKVDRLIIQMGGVREVHLACLQLLCSAHRTCRRMKKVLVIQGTPAAFQETVRELGFLRHVGCGTPTMEPCLWREEGGR